MRSADREDTILEEEGFSRSFEMTEGGDRKRSKVQFDRHDLRWHCVTWFAPLWNIRYFRFVSFCGYNLGITQPLYDYAKLVSNR